MDNRYHRGYSLGGCLVANCNLVHAGVTPNWQQVGQQIAPGVTLSAFSRGYAAGFMVLTTNLPSNQPGKGTTTAGVQPTTVGSQATSHPTSLGVTLLILGSILPSLLMFIRGCVSQTTQTNHNYKCNVYPSREMSRTGQAHHCFDLHVSFSHIGGPDQ